MNSAGPQSEYVFGPFRLDPRGRTLLGPDGPVGITAKAFDALVYLVEHAGELVERGALIGALWPTTIVGENNLNQAIAALRRTLGHDYIATVPGRGYQFVAPVTLAGRESSPDPERPPVPSPKRLGARRWRGLWLGGLAVGSAVLATLLYDRYGSGPSEDAAPAASGEPATVAVMPLENLSSDPDQAFFSNGLAEELVAVLANLPGLRVTAMDSSYALSDAGLSAEAIAARLGVDYLIDGSVARDGTRLRVRIRLSNAAGETVLARTYERELSGVFEVQQEIARAVAEELRKSLQRGVELREHGMTDD
jgi:TolB-like protein/DNA-binding winged helix-turn-helix (wHTH) protein